MRVYRRGNVYWFELVFNGQRIQRSTKSKNQRVAGQIASTFHAALIKGEVGITERKPSPRFSVAMKAFLAWSEQEHSAHPETSARYQCSSIALLKHFRDRPLDTISAEDVEEYKLVRSAQKARQSKQRLRPATVNRELACLRKMYNHAAKGNQDLRNPVSQVKFFAEDNLQTRVLTFAEQRRYLAKCTETLRDVATHILNTGMRPGEVFRLTEQVVDLEAGYLRVLKGKTPAARRRIELTPTALDVLARRLEAAGTGLLFPCERDPQRPMPGIQSAHTRALRDSKVAAFRPYDLRHTWATRAAEAGIDLVTLAAMMGHSRIQMVLRYAHPTQHHQASAMEKLLSHNLIQEKREQEKSEVEEQRRAQTGLKIVPRRA